MNPHPKILLIEDDPGIVAGLKKELQSEGYHVATATRGDEGLARAQEDACELVLTDLKMPGLSGLELIEQLHAAKPKLPIIMMTAFGTTETAIEATKLGAYDYVLKPFDMGELLDLIAKAVASSRLMSEPLEMGQARSAQSAIIGNSRAMQAIYKEIGRVGRFEQANQGTIFLDEIGDLSLSTQVKLLRVLQEKYIQRVGGNEKLPVDVRVLSATHRDLDSAMKERLFREDLFYRLSGVTITLPPLVQRREDIPDLARYFLQRSGPELGIESPSIQPEAVSYLQTQVWPGNVRELENVVRQSLLLARGYPVSPDHVQHAYTRARKPVTASDQTVACYFTELLSRAQRGELANAHARMVEDMERELYSRAIQLAQGNQAKAARWLGVTRTTMREKLARFDCRAAGEKPEQS